MRRERILIPMRFSNKSMLMPEPPIGPRIKLADSGLSKREQQVVAVWVIRGLSNREIAGRLFVAEQTVKDHLHAMFGKVKVRRRSELAAKLFGVGSACYQIPAFVG